MYNISIYSDNIKYCKTLKKSIEKGLAKSEKTSGFSIRILDSLDFYDNIKIMIKNRLFLRDDSKGKLIDAPQLDNTDILILDETINNVECADHLAYLIRCYSKCKMIIIVNESEKVQFNLGLVGNLQSFCDLSLNSKDLCNPGLWTNDLSLWESYRPWAWSIIPHALFYWDRKIEDIKDNLDNSVLLDILELDEKIASIWYRRLQAFLDSHEDRPYYQTTPREFLCNSQYGLYFRDAENMENEEVLARVAMARISKWLEQSILLEQNIFVDAPRLADIYPEIIDGPVTPKNYNKTSYITIDHTQLGINNKFYDILEPFQIKKKNYWYSRAIWEWNSVQDTIYNHLDCFNHLKRGDNIVFCEDTSRFDYHGNCNSFIAEINSPFGMRHIRDLKNIEYTPYLRRWE